MGDKLAAAWHPGTGPTRTLADRIAAALFVHPIADHVARKHPKRARRMCEDAAVAVLDAIAEHEEAGS